MIGFAAEAEDLVRNATAKLRRKNLDAVVANPVARSDSSFGAHTNRATVIIRSRAVLTWSADDEASSGVARDRAGRTSALGAPARSLSPRAKKVSARD